MTFTAPSYPFDVIRLYCMSWSLSCLTFHEVRNNHNSEVPNSLVPIQHDGGKSLILVPLVL